MLKYLFMGTPALAATVLERLCERLHPPEAVVTQIAKAQGRSHKAVPTEVEAFARKRGIHCFTTMDVNHPSTFEALRTFAPDLLLVAAFGQILKPDVLALPKLLSLNLHASLLPKYRGAAPIQRAIWNGDTETGVTVQQMARKLDSGDILLQKRMPIEDDDTSTTLMQRIAHVGGDAFVEAVELIEAGRYTLTPQKHEDATYASKIEKADALVDWTLPAKRIRDQMRALQPWPVAETKLGKDRLKLFTAHIADMHADLPPGAVLTDGKSELRVVCGDGQALSLTEIQLENRKRLGIKEFLMAYRGNFPFATLGEAALGDGS